MRSPIPHLRACAVLVALLCGTTATALAQTAPPVPTTPVTQPAANSSPTRPDMAIDAALRAQVIATLVPKMRASYVFPDVAEKMVAAVLAHDKRGAYNNDATANAFCDRLTTHLQEVSHDKHIRVRLFPDSLPEDIPLAEQASTKQSAAEREKELATARLFNYGVEKFERLPANIAYLALNAFVDLGYSGEALAAAMTLVADSEALIIDLRANRGGDPATVALVTSYLFDAGEPVHLNDLYYRWSGQTQQYWTHAWVPGKRFGASKPVYVLTSDHTFSAGEEFTNNLKVLKRATIVGATTRGGANPGGSFKLADRVGIFIPTGRAINPITKTNWEGTGVTPDVAVPPDQALLTAQVMAMQPLVAKQADAWRRDAAAKILADLQAKLDAMKTAPQK